MKLSDRTNREYRILAIAIVFFIAGAIFFWHDASLPTSHSSPSAGAPAPAVSVQSANVAPGQQIDPDFAKFPPPAQFRTFVYNQNGFNKLSTLSISSMCNAAYMAILIFPVAVDYRSDIDAAVYNDAFPCTAGQTFTLAITTSDIATAPFGTYYFIVADQEKSGAWYNPR
jgi:hypothetical protein